MEIARERREQEQEAARAEARKQERKRAGAEQKLLTKVCLAGRPKRATEREEGTKRL